MDARLCYPSLSGFNIKTAHSATPSLLFSSLFPLGFPPSYRVRGVQHHTLPLHKIPRGRSPLHRRLGHRAGRIGLRGAALGRGRAGGDLPRQLALSQPRKVEQQKGGEGWSCGYAEGCQRSLSGMFRCTKTHTHLDQPQVRH